MKTTSFYLPIITPPVINLKTKSKTKTKTTSLVTKTRSLVSITTTNIKSIIPTLTTSSIISLPTNFIPKRSGTTATLTYFTDTVFQCVGQIPDYFAVAVNPLLLGFTLDDWNTKYAGASPDKIPWCNRLMKFEVNDVTFTARIIDTCNPGDKGAFVDPNTGKIIGGKCDYTDVIDLYGESGRQFLQNVVGDDFYRGQVKWEIL
jgi:hypothetical protein